MVVKCKQCGNCCRFLLNAICLPKQVVTTTQWRDYKVTYRHGSTITDFVKPVSHFTNFSQTFHVELTYFLITNRSFLGKAWWLVKRVVARHFIQYKERSRLIYLRNFKYKPRNMHTDRGRNDLRQSVSLTHAESKILCRWRGFVYP
jgi:hypothetical protein